MKSLFFTLAVVFCCTQINYAQLSEGGVPPSFQLNKLKSSEKIQTYKAARLKINKLLEEDSERNEPLRYATCKTLDKDIRELGTKTEVQDGTIWRLQVKSKNGYSIGLNFSKYYLPEGAKLFIYNEEVELIYGAYTEKNNKPYKSFSVADYPSNKLIIEYYEPKNAEFSGELFLGEVCQAYRKIDGTVFRPESDDNIDINCPLGDKVQLQKYAIARMTFTEGGNQFTCSGSLINNTKNDGTPYFLTANHCINTSQVAQTLITFFNDEKDDCNGIRLSGQSLSGSSLKSTGADTDFTLLLLDENPPENYRPYFAGWNAESDSVVSFGMGIHHPGGDAKKVCIDYNNIFSHPFVVTWENNTTTPPNSHWLVDFDEGYTAGGSSGSPLFDENNRIVGQLHGGDDITKLYGKLSGSWDNSLSFRSLKPFLDPDGEGILKLDGFAPANNPAAAHPYSEYQTICTGENVQFKDGSSFQPDSWNWSFSPNTVDFLEGTDATFQNPIVSFKEDGNYTVTLEVEKSGVANTKVRNNYINAGDNLNLKILASQESEICLDEFNNYHFRGIGADSLRWDIVEGSEYVIVDSSTINSDTLLFSRNNGVTIDTSITIKAILTGLHGTCEDTVTDSLKIVFASNDLIENAIPLIIGENGPYNNFCTTTQTNEPNPSSGDCNTQTNWCDCENSEIILDNSVWFTFLGPESGIVGIDAPGFDNQIAVYEANSASDILSGNSNLYKILAANDDFFGEEKDYSALINRVDVVPGKKYWLQVDGSACGAFGTFNLNLKDTSLNVVPTAILQTAYKSEKLELTPNPASEYFSINNELPGYNQIIKIISLDGKTIMNEVISSVSDQIRIDLPSEVTSGLYIVQLIGESKIFQGMLSVRRD